jgi:hypothetical protein
MPAAPMGAISPWLALAFAVLIALAIKLPMRLFGRWLERKGSRMEETARGGAPEQERYDPFRTDGRS